MENELHEHDFIICPNCETKIEGRYCNFCGQKYHAHKETFGELFYEFFSDFTHWDSRFVHTVLPLLFKPGTLTKEYSEGKKNKQFHPIRLYIFSSFVYFFLVFSCNNSIQNKQESSTEKPKSQNEFKADSSAAIAAKDSVIANLPTNIKGEPILFARSDSSFEVTAEGIDGLDSLLHANTTPEQYEAWQKSLPEESRHNFIKRYTVKRALHLYAEGKNDGGTLMEKFEESVLHNIPKMMFFLLPVFALILKLLYFRNKEMYYVDHAVLSLHYFSFIFLMLTLFQFVIGNLLDLDIVFQIAALWIAIYLFIAMIRFYKQSFLKTLLKYCLIGFVFFIAFAMALIVNLIITAAIQI